MQHSSEFIFTAVSFSYVLQWTLKAYRKKTEWLNYAVKLQRSVKQMHTECHGNMQRRSEIKCYQALPITFEASLRALLLSHGL